MAEDKRITYYFEGDEFLDNLWSDVKNAKHSVFVESYILAYDRVGKEFCALLIDKAKEGLIVKVLVDAIGSFELPKSHIQEMRNAGIKVRIYRPFRLFSRFFNLNKRDHRKLIIIDSIVAYMGGMNIHEKISKKIMGENRWRDTHIKVVGPMVEKLIYYFKRSFKIIRFRSKRIERLSSGDDIVATGRVIGRNKIRGLIHRYIRRSRFKVCISSAYFIPDTETIIALKRARKRGARIQIITNSIELSDVRIVNRINRHLLRYLIKNGVEIYFYKKRMMHAKSMVFDDRVATVGSSNINYRSFFRDLEINAFFRGNEDVHILLNQFSEDIKNSRLVTFKELKNIPWYDKVIDAMWYLIRSFF